MNETKPMDPESINRRALTEVENMQGTGVIDLPKLAAILRGQR